LYTKKAETFLKDGVFKEKVERFIANQKAFEERTLNFTFLKLLISQIQTISVRPRAFIAIYTSNNIPEIKIFII